MKDKINQQQRRIFMKRKLAAIFFALIITSAMFTGCGCDNRTATADEAPTASISTETKPQTSDTTIALEDTALDKEEKSAVQEAGLKVDDKGNVTDKNGNKVEFKDGKIEIKDENGKAVEVSVDTVKTVNNNTASTNKTNSSSTSTTKKPSSSSSSSSGSSSKPSSTSSSTFKPSSSSTSKPAETKHTHSWTNITKKVKVVDQEAYSYEEPVYEEQGRTICNTCGADITDNRVAHSKAHVLNGEGGSYHDEWVKVQVGTKTVNVPEKSHYETKTVGRKCSPCGKTEYY